MPSEPKLWSTRDVSQFLMDLGFNNLIPTFQKASINGKKLLLLSDQELGTRFQCKSFQIRKIRGTLHNMVNGHTMASFRNTGRAARRSPTKTPPGPGRPSPAETSSSSEPSPQTSFSRREPASARRQHQPMTPPPRTPEAPTPRIPTYEEAHLAQYRELSETISTLENQDIENAADNAKRYAQELRAERTSALETLSRARREEKRAQMDLDTVDPGCSMCGGKKKAEMLAAKERRLESASTSVRFAAERVEGFNSEIEAARMKADSLVEKVQELHTARSNMDYLMRTIFEQPGWAMDTTLSGLRADAHGLDSQLEENTGHLETHGKGRSLLSSANKKIDKAMESLRSSRLLSGLKAGVGGEDSEFPLDTANLTRAQLLALRQATDSARSAVEDIESANEFINDLPYNNESVLGLARNGVFAAVLEPGALENEDSLQIIRDGIEMVRDLSAGLQQSLEWTRQKMQAYEMAIEQLNLEIVEKKKEILAYQHSQVKGAALLGGLVHSSFDMDD